MGKVGWHKTDGKMYWYQGLSNTFLSAHVSFFVNCSSTFYQLLYQLFYQLFINFFLYQLCVSSLSTLPTFCQLFINFWTTVYQLFIILIELMNAHCLSSVCAECLAFKGATAGASRCRAPPPSMVAATTKDYGCIWKDKQCVCANSGTYAKSSHFAGIRIMAWQMRGTQPRSSTADNLWGGHKAQHKAPVPPCHWFLGTSGTLAPSLHWRVGLMPNLVAQAMIFKAFEPHAWSCWSLAVWTDRLRRKLVREWRAAETPTPMGWSSTKISIQSTIGAFKLCLKKSSPWPFYWKSRPERCGHSGLPGTMETWPSLATAATRRWHGCECQSKLGSSC